MSLGKRIADLARHIGPGRARAERQQIQRAVRDLAAAVRAQGRRIDEVGGTLHSMTHGDRKVAIDRDVHGVGRRVDSLARASARQQRIVAQALKQADWIEELRVDERRLLRRIDRMARSDRPVIVGPWSGEVGFELLYWVPFVTWALARANVSADRVVVLSRGGPRSWYAHLAGRYLDALSLVSPEEFRRRTEEAKKQRALGAFDRDLVDWAIAREGLRRPILLHPGLMYDLFYPVWKQKATVRRIEAFTAHELFTRPMMPEVRDRLPSDYVAVRFYFSNAFPDTPVNRQFVNAILRTLSASRDVVLLNTSFHVDDHRDCAPVENGRIHTLGDLMVPERNLEVQSAVIAGAQAFVGTYGGYSYLAPLYGVPSLAFYSQRDAFFVHHLELAERVFRRLDAGPFTVLDVNHLDLVRSALAPVGVPS